MPQSKTPRGRSGTPSRSSINVEDPLRESLDELAELADSLIDNLSLDAAPEKTAPATTAAPSPPKPPSPDPAAAAAAAPAAASPTPATPPESKVAQETEIPATPPTEASARARRKAMQKTLDELSELIDAPAPAPRKVEIKVDGDRGDDIQECLDTVLTGQVASAGGAGQAEAAATPPGKADSPVKESGAPKARLATARSPKPPSPATGGIELPANEQDPSTEHQTKEIFVNLESSIDEVADEVIEPASTRSSKVGWLLLVLVIIAAAAAAAWFLLMPPPPGSAELGADLPIPDPPVVIKTVETAGTEGTAQIDFGAISKGPGAATASAMPAASKKARGDPRAPAKAAAMGLPEPASAPEPAPVRKNPAAREPNLEPEPEPVVVAESLVTNHKPPEALDRVQPSYDPQSVAAGQRLTVVLRVLIDELGHPLRVVVDEGIGDENLEAAAIEAVLSSTYSAASHDGNAIRGWTTQSFVFEGPQKH